MSDLLLFIKSQAAQLDFCNEKYLFVAGKWFRVFAIVVQHLVLS